MDIIEVCEVLIFNDQKKILLQLRDNKPEISGPGKWGLIGGRKELGEGVDNCLEREIMEEIGIDLKTTFITTINDQAGNKIYRHYIYLARCNDVPDNLRLNEGQKIEFFSWSELDKLAKVDWFDRVYLSVIKKLIF